MTDRPATAAYHAATENGPFDHQRDAYEQGYEDGITAERRRFAARLRDMAAAVLLKLRLDGASLAELKRQAPNSLQQEQGRLLLNLADLLDPSGHPQPARTPAGTNWLQPSSTPPVLPGTTPDVPQT